MSTTREDAIVSVIGWVDLALSEIPRASIKKSQRGKVGGRPPVLPYVTLSWDSDMALSATPRRVIDPDTPITSDPTSYYYLDLYVHRRATVRVSIFNEFDDDSGVDYLSELILSLSRQDVKNYLVDEDITLEPASEIIDTSTLRESKWEPSCFIDFYLYYIRHDSSAIPVIDTVDTTLSTD